MNTKREFAGWSRKATELKASPVPDFDGYFVTRSGDVYSAKRLEANQPLRKLRPGRHSQGYPNYGLCRDGRAVTMTAHKIVAITFLPRRPSQRHGIRHLDGNVENNSVENLIWGTQRENIHDKFRHGTMARGERNGRKLHPENYPVGEDTETAKLTEKEVRDIISRLAKGELGYRLAEEFGVLKTTISAIKTCRTWKHIPREAT